MATLYLVDGSSYLHRAFHALPQLTNSRGLPTNAVLGFAKMILKIVREEKPDYLAVVLDAPGKTFRDEIYSEYKANRPPMPEDLAVQIPYATRLLEGLRIQTFARPGFEADDLIGTLARRAEEKGIDVVIVSGDKDFCQCVSDRVSLLDTMKGKRTTPAEVKERFGVEPARVIEVFGLMGDSTDNIPGVPGIGEKTAVELIARFGTVEGLLARVDEVPGKKRQENLRRYADQARLSRTLATIRIDAPVDAEPESLEAGPPDEERLLEVLGELEFTRLAAGLAPRPSIEPGEERAPLPRVIGGLDEAEAWVARLLSREKIAISASVRGDPARGERARGFTLQGLAISRGPGETRFLPLGPGNDLTRAAPGLLARLIESTRPCKIGHDWKRTIHALRRAELPHRLAGGFDTQIASWLLNPSRKDYSLDGIALEHLGARPGRSAAPGVTQGELPLGPGPEEIAGAACEEAEIALELERALSAELAQAGLAALFDEVEMPLVAILADMEWAGIRVDRSKLAALSAEFDLWIQGSMARMHEMAGVAFNPNSPAQLREVLFDKLCLPPGRKTKTGLSTDVDVLESLAPLHPLPGEILKYRGLAKLKGTYVDALIALAHPATGRVHTTYNQTGTATGRLSSTDPNLQNIPIRSEEGLRIREAFVPAEGCVFVSADYSQIELRILAHLSGDETLRDAFRRGEDVHTLTASALFGVSSEAVTGEQRRKAKVVNFGIAYGMSAFGLAQELGIDPSQAQTIIARTFERYPGVKAYLEAKKEEARRQGWVSTALGRRRAIPEIGSSNANQRAAAERVAVNTPIQGSAADLMKLAMVRVARALDGEGLGGDCSLILQVHDELVLEARREKADAAGALLRAAMESALDLSVPLVVTTRTGSSWREIG